MAGARAIRAGRAFVEVFADNSKLRRGLRRAQARLQAFGGKVRTMGANLGKVGLVMAAPMAYATKVFADFDDQMRTVQAVTGTAGEAFEKLTDRAKRLGRTTSYTASQVAAAMVELGRAGFSADEIDAAIGSMLNLARATGTEIAEAANIAAASLRSFGLEASEMTRVADVMVATANNSAQTLTDLGESMKYAAPVADSFGLTIEDTTKALGALANFGIKGSQAGTTLKNIMLQLAQADVRKKIEALGVAVTDAQGGFRGLGDILTDLGGAMANMPRPERLALMSELFLKRAVAGGIKLTAEQCDKLNQAIDGAEGTAAKTAETMDAGIGGMLRRLWSAIEGVTIAIGEGLAPVLAQLGAWLTPVVTKMAAWIETNKGWVKTLAAVTGGLLGLSVAMLAIGAAVSGLAKVLGIATLALKAVGMALTLLANPLGLAIGLFVGLGAVILTQTEAGGKALDWLGGRLGSLVGDSKAAFGAIAKALAHGRIGKAAKVFWALLKLAWTQGINTLKEGWERFTFWLGKWATKGVFAILKVWEKLKTYGVLLWETLKWGFKNAGAYIKGFFRRLEADVGAALSKLLVKGQEAVGAIDADQAQYQIDYINRERDREIHRARAERDAAVRQAGHEANRRMEAQEQDERRNIKAIDDAYTRLERQKRRERDAEIARLRGQVDARRRELHDAIRDVENIGGGEGEEAPPPPEAPEPPDVGEQIKAVLDQIRGGKDALGQAAQRTFDAKGTFSPAAVQALAAGGPANAIEQNTREIAENTRRIQEGVEDGLPQRFQ